MNQNFAIQLFEGKKVRIVWDAEQEKYFAEVATTEYSRQSNPQSMAESQRIAKEGGEVAREARETMERRLGRSVAKASSG